MQILFWAFIACSFPTGAISLYNASMIFSDYFDKVEAWKTHKKAYYFFLTAGLLLWAGSLITIKYCL